MYLPTNALAALANLAPNMAGLHAVTAQKVFSLLQALSRRYFKVQLAIVVVAAFRSGVGGMARWKGRGRVAGDGSGHAYAGLSVMHHTSAHLCGRHRLRRACS